MLPPAVLIDLAESLIATLEHVRPADLTDDQRDRLAACVRKLEAFLRLT